MTDDAASRRRTPDRRQWIRESLRRHGEIPGRWYADNTREPIRDETLRYGLLTVGAVIERQGLKTTASTPRWALARDFAELFLCTRREFGRRVEEWRAQHLTSGALARLAAVQEGLAAAKAGEVLVTLPNRRTRILAPGESSAVAKAVIEVFAPRYLDHPAAVWLSESSRREEAADLRLAQLVNLEISDARILPDIVLVDHGPSTPRFVFVEVVATDGPINEVRRADLSSLLEAGGHGSADVAFVTAFLDRGEPVFRRLASDIAWNSFVWFASEPARIIHFRDFHERAVDLFER